MDGLPNGSVENAKLKVLDALTEYVSCLDDEPAVVLRATVVFATKERDAEAMSWALLNTTGPEAAGSLRWALDRIMVAMESEIYEGGNDDD